MTSKAGQNYSLSDYGDMIRNPARMSPYKKALEKAITPGCSVLDIGAGPGIFSLLACQLGAGRVVAIDPNPTIRLAQELANSNHFSHIIRCVEGISTKFESQEKFDVIISDLRGTLPFFTQHLPSIVDARNRLLKPNGALIPQKDKIWVAPLECPEMYKNIEYPWLKNDFSLDLSPLHRFFVNSWSQRIVRPQQLLAIAQLWCELDYESLVDFGYVGQLKWEADRPSTLHGLAAWFDAELYADIGFSNSPEQPDLIYGQAVFPLATPIRLDLGDEITAKISAHWIGQDYIWQWKGEVFKKKSSTQIGFDQSSFSNKIIGKGTRNRKIDKFNAKRKQ